MDLLKFRQRASKKRKSLTAFLNKLDEVVPKGFGKIVAEEDKEVWKDVDCTTCANCCKTMTPVYTPKDIKRIAEHLKMSPKDFFKKWLLKEEDSGSVVNASQPCQFLVNDKCSIYEVRPRDCAEFPHHHKRPFDLYNDTFTQNVYRCPATFELIQRLKNRVERDYEWD